MLSKTALAPELEPPLHLPVLELALKPVPERLLEC